MDPLEEAALSGKLTTPAFNGPDPDGREPTRWEDASDNDSGNDLDPDHPGSRPHSSQGMSRGRSGNTGPKGVLQDFKASHGKSGAILGGDVDKKMRKITLGGSTSGKILGKKFGSGGKSSGSESEGEREAKKAYRKSRSAELDLQRNLSGRKSPATKQMDSQGRKTFGHLREVSVQNFLQAIDSEKDEPETTVLIHLFEHGNRNCSNLNTHLATLARRHPHTKFIRALASDLEFATVETSRIPLISPSPSRASFATSSSTASDPFRDRKGSVASLGVPSDPFGDHHRQRHATDSDVLPTLLWYRGGEFVKSLHAVEREMPEGEIKDGEEGCKEVQQLLASNGLITNSDSITNSRGQLLSFHHRGSSDGSNP